MKKIFILNDTCKGCSLCIKACPRGILELGKEINKTGTQYIILIDPDRCNGCRLCSIMCPDSAIEVFDDER